MSSKQYFSYIQDENKSNNKKWSQWSYQHLIATEKTMKSLEEIKILVFCSVYNVTITGTF